MISNKKIIYTRGVMIVEAMVAITILVTSLFGILTLISRSLSLNRVINDQMVAANLAIEGIELVKNKIDSNYVNPGILVWNKGIGEGLFEMDFNDIELVPIVPSSKRKLNYDSETGKYSYDETINGKQTRFVRVIEIKLLTGGNQLQVNSRVNWTTRGGGEFDIDLEDRFFNWRVDDI